MVQTIRITLPDGHGAVYPAGITVKEALAVWSEEKLATAVAAKVNRVPVDLSFALSGDAAVEPIAAASVMGVWLNNRELHLLGVQKMRAEQMIARPLPADVGLAATREREGWI